MRRILPLLLVALSLVVGVDRASAGERPPAEIAVGVSRLAPIYFDLSTDDLTQATLDIRFTQPLTPRFAFEAIGTVGHRDTGYGTTTEGLYLLQIRQRLVRAEGTRLKPFLTYGVVGYHGHFKQPARDFTLPNGDVFRSPATTYHEVDAPLLTSIGGGVQYQVGSHAAIRADVQLVTLLYIPVGTRTSVGVSIPFGSYSNR